MSVDKAYAELFKGKKGTKVIVGIVDSGVDIRHEDLKGVIWNQPKRNCRTTEKMMTKMVILMMLMDGIS